MSSLGLGKGAVGKVRTGGGLLVVRSVGWFPLGTDAIILSVCGFVGCGCSGRNAREKNCLDGSSSGHGNIDSWRRMGLDGFPL